MKRFSLAIAIGCLCLQVAGCSDAETREWPEMPDSDTGLALILSPDSQTIKNGDEPVFTAKLINRGTRELTLVAPGDGSDCGWRTPLLEWSRVPRDPGGRCGNTNPLKSDDVFKLQPGEARVLKGWLRQPYLSGRGHYRVSLRYTNEPERGIGGIPVGEHDPAALEAVQHSTPVTVVSNAVEIVVE